MTPTQPPTSFHAILSRVFWMLLGPVVLAILTYTIISKGSGWFTPADFAFLAVLVFLLLARWLEFRGGNALTAFGEPATPIHLRRYALRASALGLAAWVVANLIGNHLLAG